MVAQEENKEDKGSTKLFSFINPEGLHKSIIFQSGQAD